MLSEMEINIVKLKTEMKGLDQLVGDRIESGPRNILHRTLGTGKTVLAIVKMEGCECPLEWIPFKITGKGIELLRK